MEIGSASKATVNLAKRFKTPLSPEEYFQGQVHHDEISFLSNSCTRTSPSEQGASVSPRSPQVVSTPIQGAPVRDLSAEDPYSQ